MCALAPAAFAAEPSFQNLKKLDTVDGYTTYGGESKSGDEFYIFVDGGKKTAKSLPSIWLAYLTAIPGLPWYRVKLWRIICATEIKQSFITASAPTKPSANWMKPIKYWAKPFRLPSSTVSAKWLPIFRVWPKKTIRKIKKTKIRLLVLLKFRFQTASAIPAV